MRLKKSAQSQMIVKTISLKSAAVVEAAAADVVSSVKNSQNQKMTYPRIKILLRTRLKNLKPKRNPSAVVGDAVKLRANLK